VKASRTTKRLRGHGRSGLITCFENFAVEVDERNRDVTPIEKSADGPQRRFKWHFSCRN
jgi:hypothetical protein